jgi:hypothetical protein
MNARVTPLQRRRSCVALLAIIAACSPFSAAVDDGAIDGGGAGGAQSDAARADGGGAGDGATDTTDAAVSSEAGSGAADGGALQYADGGFCASFTKPIFCFDFDENNNPPQGLTVMQSGGASISYPGTFPEGSAPSALKATVGASARATATAPTIDLTKQKNADISIAFAFDIPVKATTAQYVARLNFTSQSSPISLNGANGFACGGTTFANIATGTHHVVVSVAVDAMGNAVAYNCSLDGVTSVGASVAPSLTLSVELGNVMGGGVFTATYDDFVANVP